MSDRWAANPIHFRHLGTIQLGLQKQYSILEEKK